MNDIYSAKSLRWSRRLSTVPRWTIVPTIQRQNVAEHTFHVARTALWLVGEHARAQGNAEDRLSFEMDVLRWALQHDEDEAATGDRPTPSKNGKPHYASMPQHAIVVKVADILEALAFLMEEKLMGNTRLGDIFTERTQALQEVWGFFAQKERRSHHALLNEFFGVIFASHPGME
jgi:HD containing hydrolase-like enzyme